MNTGQIASMLVTVVAVAVAAIQTSGGSGLGIPTVIFNWLAIVAAMLTAVQGFLPAVHK